MVIEEKLKRLILYKFGRNNAFCAETGIPESTLSTIFKRGILNTTTDKLVTICDALNISIDEAIKGRIVFNDDNDKDYELLDKFNSLSEHSKGLIEVIMDYELNEKEEKVVNFKPAPKPDLRAASGAEEDSDEILEYNLELARQITEKEERKRKNKKE